jgi:hypothetical protein
MAEDYSGDPPADEYDDQKPKRLDEATAAYLQDLDLAISTNDGKTDIDEDDGGKALLVANVLDEIKSKTASAACDRRTNAVVEQLCTLAAPAQNVLILQRLAPYTMFLAQNRHSSHVLQAVMSRTSYMLLHELDVIGEDVDEDEFITAVHSICEPLTAEVSWLAKDINGSHVVRAMIALLAGLPIIAERKSKNSKHQHSIAHSVPLEKLLRADRFYFDSDKSCSVPESFHETLIKLSSALAALPGDDLRSMACDSTGGGVLGLLLRVLSAPDIVAGGPAAALSLVRAVLSWSEDQPERNAEIVFNMSGDKSGAYFLETAIECAPLRLVLELLDCSFELGMTETGVNNNSSSSSSTSSSSGGKSGDINEKCFVRGGRSRPGSTRPSEYASHGSANFVIQAALRRLEAELRLGTQESQSTPENESNSAFAMRVSDALLRDLASNGTGAASPLASVGDLLVHRGGVLFWMVRCASAMHIQGAGERASVEAEAETEECTQPPASAAEVLAAYLVQRWAGDDHAAAAAVALNVGQNGFRNLAKDAKKILKTALVSFLQRSFCEHREKEPIAKDGKDGSPGSGAKDASKDAYGSRGYGPKRLAKPAALSAQILTARLVGAVLQLAHQCPGGAVVSRALTSCNPETLVFISTTGPISRSILDLFFEAGFTEKDRMNLLTALEPCLVTLANHHVGQHIVRRLWETTPMNERRRLAAALAPAAAVLRASKEGRRSLYVTFAEAYAEDPAEWQRRVKRQQEGVGFLDELSGAAASGYGHSNHGQNSDAADQQDNRDESARRVAYQSFMGSVEGRGANSTGGPGVAEDAEAGVADESGTGTGGRKRKRSRKGKGKGAEEPQERQEQGPEEQGLEDANRKKSSLHVNAGALLLRVGEQEKKTSSKSSKPASRAPPEKADWRLVKSLGGASLMSKSALLNTAATLASEKTGTQSKQDLKSEKKARKRSKATRE